MMVTSHGLYYLTNNTCGQYLYILYYIYAYHYFFFFFFSPYLFTIYYSFSIPYISYISADVRLEFPIGDK